MNITYSADKPLHWVGSSKKDLLDFPNDVISDVGYSLGVVQEGGMPPSAKPWKGEFWKLWKPIGEMLSEWYTPFDLNGQFTCCIVSRKNHLLESELRV